MKNKRKGEIKILKDNQSNLPTNMKIVSLYGSSETGKTITLKILMGLLEKNGQLISGKNNVKDAWGVFKLLNANGKNVKVGITTKGDTVGALEKDFKKMLSYDCDLYVCASHTYGSTVTWLQNRTKNGYLLRLGKATVEKLQGQVPSVSTITEQAINTWQAEKLFGIVISLL